jgi:hypothetical protein
MVPSKFKGMYYFSAMLESMVVCRSMNWDTPEVVSLSVFYNLSLM